MNTIEIKLAGLLFKVWYDGETYEVDEVRRYNVYACEGWNVIPEGMMFQVMAYLTPDVLERAGAKPFDTLEIDI